MHVADELLKHGWNGKTVLSKLREELYDSDCEFDFIQIEQFVNATYDEQREMIFQYLFGVKSSQVIDSYESNNGLSGYDMLYIKNFIESL